MTPEMRKRYDEQVQERMNQKEKLFEHLKYNMNSNKPSTIPMLWLTIVWDVQWDKLRDNPTVEYPPVRSLPPPRKREGKSISGEEQNS
jgi:hypothetical protein